MESYDVVVIGAGPGGYVAAIRAAHHGLRVAVVERDKQLGGTCLLRGCIPTKSMLHAADLLEQIKGAASLGIGDGKVSFDFAKVQAERQKQVKKGAQGVAYLLKQNKIDVLAGHGRLTGPNEVEVQAGQTRTKVHATRGIIVATGSVPKGLPHLPLDGQAIISSDELLEIDAPPKRMMILGAGAVGVEFASVFSRFGTECTIVEMQERLVPQEDEEVSKEFARIYKKRGITCLTGTKLVSANKKNGAIEVVLDTKGTQSTVTCDVVLVATGRKPVTDDIGLQALGITTDKRGYIDVNAHMQTQVPSIYAIGDAVATPWLAHVASSEGMLAADIIAGKHTRPINYRHVPGCTYSQPEIGSVGLSESAAKAEGYTVKVGKYPFSAVPKARILGETDGFVKIVTDTQYGEVLGVHIVGPHATDLIAEAGMAMALESTAEEIAHTMHAHPSLAESLLEAAHAAHGRAIHM